MWPFTQAQTTSPPPGVSVVAMFYSPSDLVSFSSVTRNMAEVDEIRQEARRNTRGRFEQWAKNPTCEANALSAVHNIRLDKAAEAAGIQATFGQSPFAITRGNRFEAGLFFEEAARLRSALERRGVLPEDSAGFLDLRLRMNGGTRIPSVDEALRETAAWLQRIAAN